MVKATPKRVLSEYNATGMRLCYHPIVRQQHNKGTDKGGYLVSLLLSSSGTHGSWFITHNPKH